MNTFDLVRRQQARIAELEHRVDLLTRKIGRRDARIERLNRLLRDALTRRPPR